MGRAKARPLCQTLGLSKNMEISMFKLPDYEVVIHIQMSEFSASLEKEIEIISKDLSLDKSTEYCGQKDYHWAFETWESAAATLERFKHLVNNPNLLMLQACSIYDQTISPIHLKDIKKS